jgi:hypothetical protein
MFRMTVESLFAFNAERAKMYREIHGPRLDEFRARVRSARTSDLVVLLTGSQAVLDALCDPEEHSVQEQQLTFGAAMVAICDELDVRLSGPGN